MTTPSSLPTVSPRTVPAVVATLAGMSVVWLGTGGLIATLGGPIELSANPLEALLAGATPSNLSVGLLLSVVGIFVGQIGMFVSNLNSRPYEELSATAIIGPRTVFGPVLFVLVLAVGFFLAGGSLAAARGPVFVVVVVGRTCVDVADELGVTERYTPGPIDPDAHVGHREPVHLGDGDPLATWTTDRSSVVLAKVVTSPGRVFPHRGGMLVGLIALFGWLALDGVTGFVVAGGVVAIAAAIGAVPIGIEADILYGHLEYRLYDDCLVAYDRLLDTPQWRTELSEITETESSAAFLDRLPRLTLEQLSVRTDDGSQKLVGLTDANAVCDRVDDLRFDRTHTTDEL